MAKSTLVQRGERKVVRIERLAVGGKGVARYEGLVIFVADSAPGDEAEVEITFVKKNFAEAKLVRIVNPAESRIIPPCPVAGICGGCNWQHISYEEQLKSKRGLVFESLQKFSGFDLPIESIDPVVPSPREFRYRNRIQLHHSGHQIGFYKRGSHDIVDIQDCPITDERIAKLIPELRQEFRNKKPGRFEVYLSQDGQIGKRGLSMNEETEGAGPAFSQVNTQQNEQLVTHTLTLVTDYSPTRIFDLYAGSGNFTFPIAQAFPSVEIIAVELSSESVKLGRSRASKQVQFIEASVDDFVKTHDLGGDTLVFLDPPRTGCGPDVTRLMAEQRPKHVIYISCHPATLARDLKPFQEASYRIRSVRPFDMFPQTDHVETVVSLELP